ncbi:MAG: cyclic lactone autoinducer peptide [Eubacteriales bacterium]|nr:cyclic lactone autoinducer peptide [Eubacteriales bacterium]
MLNDKVRKAVVAVSKKITKATVNSTCCILVYQDKVPEKAKKLRKF